MKYWLVAGLWRPRFLGWLEDNISRISGGHHTHAVVVETGAAEGCWSRAGTVLQEPRRGVVPFLSRALEHIRSVADPDDWFVRVDADDYYGPKYLDVVDSVRRQGAEGTGIPSVYLRTEDDSLYFCKSKRDFLGPGGGACGGTLAGRVGSLVEFRETGAPWGEDSLWVQDMLVTGCRMVPRHSVDYSMVRWEEGDHTYPIRGHELPHCWNCDAYLLGQFSTSKVARAFEPVGLPIPPDVARISSAFDRLRFASRYESGISRS